MNHDDVVIVAAARTPQGRLKGQLAPLTAVQLGSIAIRGALTQGGVSPDAVDAVLVGQVLPAGAGQNPARQAAVGAGIPWSVHSSSVNKVCLSGLSAIIDGHFTTVIAGVVLAQYGTGPLKGFAVTLIVGVVCSVFTGVTVSRVMFDFWVRFLGRQGRLDMG